MFMNVLRPASCLSAFLLAAGALLMAGPAAAGAPEDWGIHFVSGASPIRDVMDHFHDYYLVPMMFGVTALVMTLLSIVIIRYNRRMNPQPAGFAHNTVIEIIWTALPIIILLVIAIPSMRLLYYTDKVEKPDLTIKVVGHQWYWSYEYPDHGNFAFDSRPIWDSSAVTEEQAAALIKEAAPGWLIPTPQPRRLLEADNRMVVPVGQNIRIFVAAGDVIHSWFAPGLGVQKAATPGRLNETWLKADREGIYYGQCTQICGIGHGYMPIVIEAVARERFEAWVKTKQPAAPAEPAAPDAPAAPAQ